MYMLHVLSALRLRYHTGPSPWTVLGSVHATAPRTIHIPVDDRPMAARGAGSVGPCVPVRYTRAASTTDTPQSTRIRVHCTSLPSCWRAMLRTAVLRVLTNTHGEYRSSRGGLPPRIRGRHAIARHRSLACLLYWLCLWLAWVRVGCGLGQHEPPRARGRAPRCKQRG